MSDELLQHLEPLLTPIASEYGRRTRVHGADTSDIFHELVCWVLLNADEIQRWRDEMEPEDFDKYMARCLRNEGNALAQDVKAQSLGYRADDVYHYSKGELKSLLPAMFDKSKWLEPPESDGRSTKAPAEGGNWIATLADVAQGFERLDLEDRILLSGFYQKGLSNGQMADLEKVADATMSYRHDRAINRLLKIMGGPFPHPTEGTVRSPWQGRRAMSNAQAIAITGSDYDD